MRTEDYDRIINYRSPKVFNIVLRNRDIRKR